HGQGLPLGGRLRVTPVDQQPRRGRGPPPEHAEHAERDDHGQQPPVQPPPRPARRPAPEIELTRDPAQQPAVERSAAERRQNLFSFGNAAFFPSRPYMSDQISRSAGAAASPPAPPSDPTTTTTYRRAPAGSYEANQEVSVSPNASAVPVLPATASFPNGKPAKAPAAVPDLGTSASASRM